jgi:hypothetical protein
MDDQPARVLWQMRRLVLVVSRLASWRHLGSRVVSSTLLAAFPVTPVHTVSCRGAF